MKILNLDNNLSFNIQREIETTKAFFFPYITLDFETKNINIPITIEKYKIVQGFDKNTGKPANIGYMGVDDKVRTLVRGVSPETYDIVMLTYDQDTLTIPSDSVVTSWVMAVPLFPKTEFVQIATNQYSKDNDKIVRKITHELLHAFCFYANRCGIPVIDEMDMTTDGKPYYKNDDMYAPDGNYARTLRNLKPFFDHLKAPETPKMPPHSLLRRGMKGLHVQKLQEALITLLFLKGRADGNFGPMTFAAVVKFQKSVGITADGIAGTITQTKLAESLKKKSSFSKWKLVPELEVITARFLHKCTLAGYNLKITSGSRSMEEQQALYNQGRTTAGKIITNAKPGKSKHNFGKAFDVAFVGKTPYPKNFDWTLIGEIGESVGLKWGGRWKGKKVDLLHFEI